MDKIAKAVRRAEVNGFVAGLIDSGIMKVANEEEAAVVADVIEEHLPEDYDMEDAMAIAAEVVDALGGEAEGGEVVEDEGYEDEDMVVEASDRSGEVNETALMAAFGELSMAKMAGEISAEQFEKEAASLQGGINAVRDLASKAYTGNAGAGFQAVRKGVSSGASGVRNSLRAKADSFGRAFGGKGVGRAKGAISQVQGKVDASAAQAQKMGLDPAVFGGNKAKLQASLQKNLGNERRRTYGARALVGGAALGTAGGAGYGAKSLYDKYNQ